MSAPEGDQLKSPSVQGSAAWVRSWLWYHGEKGPCHCVFVGLGPMGTHGGSHHHTYLTLSTRVGNSFESLVFSSVHSVNFLRQSAGLFILPPVLSSQVIFFLTAY